MELFPALCLAIIITFLVSEPIQAQAVADRYSTGFGVRLGNTPGLSLKRLAGEQGSLEALLEVFRQRDYDGFLVTALYEYHIPAFQVPRLYWFLGGGVHAGAYTQRAHSAVINEPERDDNGVLYGLDAIAGLEYRFSAAPFTIGADVKPSLTIPTNRANWLNGAVTVRWVW